MTMNSYKDSEFGWGGQHWGPLHTREPRSKRDLTLANGLVTRISGIFSLLDAKLQEDK